VAALWPARAETRAAYSRTLAQRNALLSRLRAGAGSADSLDVWDAELAGHGIALMGDRSRAAGELAPLYGQRAAGLGLPDEVELAYRPRSAAGSAGALVAELRERRDADLERGFTAHGPHRDDLRLAHGGVALRTYGSQGQQRIALLALLFAERDLLLRERGSAPLMLLDDVMSELDSARRELLSELLRAEGQSVLTTTELEHVPAGSGPGVVVVDVATGTATTRGHAQPERA
jgi:DNA replication and repair protein RecF